MNHAADLARCHRLAEPPLLDWKRLVQKKNLLLGCMH